MNVSTSSIVFHQRQSVQSVLMQNPSLLSLIFKIKITSTDLFSISPGKGVIKPLQKTQITIRLNRFCDISAKLLISYVQVEEVTAESIDQQMARRDKQSISNIIIPITRAPMKEKEENKEEKSLFKKTESPIYEMQVGAEEEQTNRPKMNSTVGNLKKTLSINSSSNLYKSVEDLDRRDTNMSKVNVKLQKQLESVKELNKKMTQRLLQKEKKIMYYTNLRQIQVNKSMDNKQGNGWSICNAALLVFLLLMVGFFLSKCEFPSL